MHILFIRHGEPSYDKVHDLSLVSYLGELTPDGIQQAKKVASVIVVKNKTKSEQTKI